MSVDGSFARASKHRVSVPGAKTRTLDEVKTLQSNIELNVMWMMSLVSVSDPVAAPRSP